jgi:hypothetical protein
MRDIIKQNFLDYLDRLLILKENATQSYFRIYDETPFGNLKKIGYEVECPIDEYQISKIDKEISEINEEIERRNEKIFKYKECKSYYFIKFPSKINTQTKK